MNVPDARGDALRIVTLNIQHGGGTRIEKLSMRLLSYDAEVLVLTEYQREESAPLVRSLATEGYKMTSPVGVDPKLNTVLIASRQPIAGERPFSSILDPRHLWCAETAGIRLCAAYLPVPTEVRVPHLEALIAEGPAQGVELIIGDFNTGKKDVDTSSTRATFPRSDLLDGLAGAGYTDLWRDAHPEGREYSYYSWKDGKPHNGFRIDHAFADPPLKRRVVGCAFDQKPRRAQETDHAALSVWLRGEPIGRNPQPLRPLQ